LPVSLGEAKNVKIAIDKARNPEFLTALGLVVWGGHSLPNSAPNPFKKNISNAFSKVKGFIGKMMPQ